MIYYYKQILKDVIYCNIIHHRYTLQILKYSSFWFPCKDYVVVVLLFIMCFV